jgi:TPR repeat protein
VKRGKLLIFGLAVALLGGAAFAQPLQISPQPAQPADDVAEKPKPKAPVRPPLKKSIAEPIRPRPPAPSAYAPENTLTTPFPAPDKPQTPPASAQVAPPTRTTSLQPQVPASGGADLAYGAYQRGYYLEAFQEATRRAGDGDPVAMTLLGDLYSNGYGIPKDDKKALAWFSLAADRNEKQAIFALAMAKFAGRGTAQDMPEAAALLERAAKLGHVAAAYNLALLYLDGQSVRPDMARAAALLRGAADAGSPEAQYALATLYKEGNGVPKDPGAAAKLLAAATRGGNPAAEVEYAIALFNGSGVPKDEGAAAALFRKAALKGSPIAQNRLARILATGRGVPADPAAAVKWHTIAKAGGESDIFLENYMQKMKDSDRAAGENAARLWLAHARPNS